MSDTYVDCRRTTMRRDAAQPIADLFEPFLPAGAQAVGGLTAGADPIAYAIRDLCRKPVDAFMVRKEPKAHGHRRAVEGPVAPGMRVVVIDDVATTGGSTLKAMEACAAEGLQVVAVVVLVDREEGGLDAIRDAAGPSVPVRAIFKKSELKERWLARRAGAHGPRTSASAR